MKKINKKPKGKTLLKTHGNLSLVPSDLFRTTGDEISRRLLAYPDSREQVQKLSKQDYFWLVKKAGEESLSLLALGSEEQWRHLLDIDLWDRDRIDENRLALWVERLGDADPERFVEWLLSDGLSLCFIYLYKALDIITITPDDEDIEIPDGFFTFDGVIYMRPRNENSYNALRSILETMVRSDMERFNSVIVNLGGIVTAETEEEIYHFRNARLADDGFTPFDEAVELYIPLDPASLETMGNLAVIDIIDDDENPVVVPGLPLSQVDGSTFFMNVIDRFSDAITVDRVRFEFAGLCNQILSADGFSGRELEELSDSVEKAGGYINLALEKLAWDDPGRAEHLLRSHSLHTLFRVGFGLVTEAARATERWINRSWFNRMQLPLSFWGDSYEKALRGLLARRPRFHAGGEEYRNFAGIEELEACRSTMARVEALDKLLSRVDENYSLGGQLPVYAGLTVQSLLVTLFAKIIMGADLGFSSISLDEARHCLDLLRRGETVPPYKMTRQGDAFLSFFTGFLDPGESGGEEARSALASIWSAFREEYENIESSDISPRYTNFLMIEE
ncbi:MAG: DUF6178 family protein [Syntrophales bacterium]|nr:DUF6178 family protein [Syntrophales bacterium]